MSKYTGRINSIIEKTHQFVSHADFCLARDYLKCRADVDVKPADLDERVKKVWFLWEQLKRKNEPAALARYQESLQYGPALMLALVLPDAEENCRKYPNGIWLSKEEAKHYIAIADKRRDDLRKNREKER